MRRHQKPEQDEHHDLRQPGRGIEKGHHRIMRPRRPVADDDAGEIDREKARRMRDLGDAENHQRRGGDERRVQALRQRHALSASTTSRPPITPMMAPRIASRANSSATCETSFRRSKSVRPASSVRNTANGSLVPDSASSVAPTRGEGASPGGGAGETPPRRRSRRRPRRPGGLGPAELERLFGDRRREQRGHQHADGRQHHRGRQHGADALKPVFKPPSNRISASATDPTR